MNYAKYTNQLKGLIVPLLTPIAESGEIDYDALFKHLDYLVGNGVRRLMINGTTGEFFSALPDERRKIVHAVRSHFSGFIVCHIGGSNLRQNVQEIAWANEYGADAIAVLPPYYPAALSQQAIVDYLCQLEAASDVPFILYNFPKHTGNAMTPELLKQVPHAALKDSAQNFALIKATSCYFVGSSTNILPAIEAGALGFVSATANVFPSLYVGIEAAIDCGDAERSCVLQKEIRACSRSYSKGGIALLKQSLRNKLLDYPPYVRSPLNTLFA